MSKTTTRTLSGVGDPNAPVGSKEWLEYVVNYAKSTARDVSAKCGDLQKILQTMQECDAHKAAGFASFEMFLSRRIGISADQAKAVLEAKPSVKVAAVLRKVGRPKATGGNDGISIVSPVGSGPAYWAARLRRDHPDADFDESVRGSVRQAAIAAGIVKVPTVLDRLRTLWAKASEADRRAFMEEITDGR
jgi:hypothetical protein